MAGFVESLKNIFKGKAATTGPSYMVGGGNPWIDASLTSSEKTERNPKNVSFQIEQFKGAVYNCVSLLAQVAASVPLRLYYHDTGDEEPEEITDHIFLDTWKNINPFTNNFEFVEGTLTDLGVTGNNFSYVGKNSLGVPQEFYRLDPRFMQVVTRGIIPVGYKFIRGGGKEPIPFALNEVLHFKLYNPKNTFYGMGFVEAAAVAIALQNQIDATELSSLRKGFRPGGIVRMESEPDDKKEFESWCRQFNEKYTTAAKTGQIVFATPAMGEITFPDIPITDYQFLEGRASNEAAVYKAAKVPLSFASRAETPSRATIDSDMVALIQFGVKPILIRIQEKINEVLMPQYGNDGRLFCAFDFESVMPTDRDMQIKQARLRYQERKSNIECGYSLPDEEREKDGEEPRSDGLGGIEWKTLNQIPAEVAANSEPSGESVSSKLQVKGKSAKKEVGISAAERDRLIKSNEDQMRRDVKGVFKDIEEKTVALLENAE